MPIVERYSLGSFTPVMTTELNSLSNNSLAVSASPYDNTSGYINADIQLVVTFSASPSANSAICVWFLSSPDGTSYEDGSASVTPARIPDVILPVRAVSTAQRINRRVVLPWGTFKILFKNDGTGQALLLSGNVLSIRPVTLEVGS